MFIENKSMSKREANKEIYDELRMQIYIFPLGNFSQRQRVTLKI